MPSSYTTNLRLTLPADGELVGTWGQTVNNGITQLIETAISGMLALAMPDANYTLITANGSTDEARNMAIRLSGTLTTGRNLVVPTAPKLYFIDNTTGQTVTVKTSAGSGVGVPAGKRAIVWCDGTNVLWGVNYVAGDLAGNVTGNASTATALQTGRTINGVLFDGTANITLPDPSLASNAFLDRVRLNQGIF
jgi:hypothetical protein